jgi:hypothetical protein
LIPSPPDGEKNNDDPLLSGGALRIKRTAGAFTPDDA